MGSGASRWMTFPVRRSERTSRKNAVDPSSSVVAFPLLLGWSGNTENPSRLVRESGWRRSSRTPMALFVQNGPCGGRRGADADGCVPAKKSVGTPLRVVHHGVEVPPLLLCPTPLPIPLRPLRSTPSTPPQRRRVHLLPAEPTGQARPGTGRGRGPAGGQRNE